MEDTAGMADTAGTEVMGVRTYTTDKQDRNNGPEGMRFYENDRKGFDFYKCL